MALEVYIGARSPRGWTADLCVERPGEWGRIPRGGLFAARPEAGQRGGVEPARARRDSARRPERAFVVVDPSYEAALAGRMGEQAGPIEELKRGAPIAALELDGPPDVQGLGFPGDVRQAPGATEGCGGVGRRAGPVAEPKYKYARPSSVCPASYVRAPTRMSSKPSLLTSPAPATA